jgi:hypothetical protein
MGKRKAPMQVGAGRADNLVRILAQECATCNPVTLIPLIRTYRLPLP